MSVRYLIPTLGRLNPRYLRGVFFVLNLLRSMMRANCYNSCHFVHKCPWLTGLIVLCRDLSWFGKLYCFDTQFDAFRGTLRSITTTCTQKHYIVHDCTIIVRSICRMHFLLFVHITIITILFWLSMPGL